MLRKEVISFIKVAELGSFHKAAEELFITPAALMKQINNLEKEIGQNLLNRTPRGVNLTEIGQIYYRELNKLKNQNDLIKKKINNSLNNLQQTLRIATSMLTPCDEFIKIYEMISESIPSIKIKIVPLDENVNISTSIKKIGDTFDVIAIMADSYEWQNRYLFYPLNPQKLCISVPRKHPLSKNKLITLCDLKNENLVIAKAGISNVMDEFRNYLDKVNTQFIEIEDSYDLNTFNYCVDNNYLLVNVKAWKNIHPELVTIDFEKDFEIPFGLLYTEKSRDKIESVIQKYENNN